MAHPHLTEYLLVLATDSTKLEEYNKADKKGREKLGKAAHLTSKQSDVLETANATHIMDEVYKELGHKKGGHGPGGGHGGGGHDGGGHGPGPHGGTHYTIQLALDLHPCKKSP
jgi:hypothetical protein